jgi:dUTP pyrophosphatase
MFSDENELTNLMKSYGLNMEDLEYDMENQINKVKLKYKTTNGDIKPPKYAYESDSGFDIYSNCEVVIEPFGRKLISTGLYFDIPENHEIQVRSKSGLALNMGLMVLNSPGTVDFGYTGEFKVILFNTNNHPVKIEKNMKIAQAVLSPVLCGKWVELKEVNEISKKDRNENGFGSTGI